MKILFCGDIVGRAGRDAINKYLPTLKAEKKIDFIIINADNAAGGFGVNADNVKELLNLRVDVITGGDHIWDQKNVAPLLEQEKRLLRPYNFPARTPGSGFNIFTDSQGRKIAVLHLLGQVFIKDQVDCPFAAAQTALTGLKLGSNIQAIFVDFHAEATSEKTAMGHFLDGQVTAIAGSHTHIPTADARILKNGSAYQTDTGMCGDYNSVIGFDIKAPLQRFTTKIRKHKMEPASGEGSLCGLLVESDDATGLAINVEQIILPKW